MALTFLASFPACGFADLLRTLSTVSTYTFTQRRPEQVNKPRLAQFSPISKLPAELLVYIFIFALPEPVSAIPASPQSTAHMRFGLRAPWILAQVCHHWRAVALSLPRLWSSVGVFTGRSGHTLASLATQIHRATNAPLDVLIAIERPLDPKPPSGPWFWHERNTRTNTTPEFDAVLQALVRYCGRWRSVHLYCDVILGRHPAFDSLSPMPLLTELVFSGERADYHSVWPCESFTDMPNLRKVVLGSVQIATTGCDTLPWTQLTTYQTAYYDGPSHLSHLSAAPNLVECQIGYHRSDSPQFYGWNRGVVTLKSLRRLVLTNDAFLTYLLAPALEELYVHRTITHLSPFFQNSGRALTHLTLSTYPADGRALIDLLRHTPVLTHLALDLDDSHGAELSRLISALTIRSRADEEPLCRLLVSLAWGDLADTMDADAFADMVESRWRAPRRVCSRLQFVAVYGAKPVGRRLREFESEGMEVVLLNRRRWRLAIDSRLYFSKSH
ncbi:hypothetical protein DFH07DRAFT_798205 [Mycena maculata]|uniref:F-box domain-containing protein n=1 Tax=Mycena maculata TaxID=230809 RepID=A0AAD7K4D3_9AGAR|nr:hypothetical protein DFH07DRAFT_798205 [Mycena maculata]